MFNCVDSVDLGYPLSMSLPREKMVTSNSYPFLQLHSIIIITDTAKHKVYIILQDSRICITIMIMW